MGTCTSTVSFHLKSKLKLFYFVTEISCEFCSQPFDSVPTLTTCGYLICKSHLDLAKQTIECNMCDEVHEINVQDCLNIPKNKKKFKEHELKIKNQELDQKIEKFEKIIKDPLANLNESYESIFRQVDLRREEAKIELIKMVDLYYNNLIQKIELDKQENYKKIQNIINIFKNETPALRINSNSTKLKDLESSIQKVEDKINDLTLIENLIQKPKYLILKSSVANEFKIADFFGYIDYKNQQISEYPKTLYWNLFSNISRTH